MPDTEPGRIVESLSLLPSDELDKVPYLMDKLADDGKSLWVFLALAWVHDHKDEFGDPLSAVEMLYADFGYPEEMAGIVRFVPPPGGAAAGVDGIEERWQAYLEDRRNYYLGRIVLKSHASQWNGLPAAKIRLSGGRVVDVNEQYDG